ncbi:hypothetical protein FVE85_7625 [Porphyridium purpureum]|uniref:Uncharacterized protein n=1 Tax=Porphyridium purpureum TaxID=35688 RepID=A0A5J4ZA87_PORPP|nr:hypothetical protein FVE85_7625 [Porphyridium purpureum]|eukprot:POR1688..scf295_1
MKKLQRSLSRENGIGARSMSTKGERLSRKSSREHGLRRTGSRVERGENGEVLFAGEDDEAVAGKARAALHDEDRTLGRSFSKGVKRVVEFLNNGPKKDVNDPLAYQGSETLQKQMLRSSEMEEQDKLLQEMAGVKIKAPELPSVAEAKVQREELVKELTRVRDSRIDESMAFEKFPFDMNKLFKRMHGLTHFNFVSEPHNGFRLYLELLCRSIEAWVAELPSTDFPVPETDRKWNLITALWRRTAPALERFFEVEEGPLYTELESQQTMTPTLREASKRAITSQYLVVDSIFESIAHLRVGDKKGMIDVFQRIGWHVSKYVALVLLYFDKKEDTLPNAVKVFLADTHKRQEMSKKIGAKIASLESDADSLAVIYSAELNTKQRAEFRKIAFAGQKFLTSSSLDEIEARTVTPLCYEFKIDSFLMKLVYFDLQSSCMRREPRTLQQTRTLVLCGVCPCARRARSRLHLRVSEHAGLLQGALRGGEVFADLRGVVSYFLDLALEIPDGRALLLVCLAIAPPSRASAGRRLLLCRARVSARHRVRRRSLPRSRALSVATSRPSSRAFHHESGPIYYEFERVNEKPKMSWLQDAQDQKAWELGARGKKEAARMDER